MLLNDRHWNHNVLKLFTKRLLNSCPLVLFTGGAENTIFVISSYHHIRKLTLYFTHQSPDTTSLCSPVSPNFCPDLEHFYPVYHDLKMADRLTQLQDCLDQVCLHLFKPQISTLFPQPRSQPHQHTGDLSK